MANPYGTPVAPRKRQRQESLGTLVAKQAFRAAQFGGHALFDAAGAALGAVEGGLSGAVYGPEGFFMGTGTGAIGGAIAAEEIYQTASHWFDDIEGDVEDLSGFSNSNNLGVHNQMVYKTKRARKAPSRRRRSTKIVRVPRRFTGVTIPELKHFDVGVGATPIDITNQWTTYTVGFNPSQGTDYNQRIGRKVRVVKFEYQCNVYCGSTAPNLPAGVNLGGEEILVMIWQNKRTNGSNSLSADIWDVEDGGTVRNMSSLRNVDNLKKFKLISAMRHDVAVASASANVVTAAHITPAFLKHSYRMNMPVEWDGGATVTIANCLNNSLAVSVCNAFGSTGLKLKWEGRIWYVDA